MYKWLFFNFPDLRSIAAEINMTIFRQNNYYKCPHCEFKSPIKSRVTNHSRIHNKKRLSNTKVNDNKTRIPRVQEDEGAFSIFFSKFLSHSAPGTSANVGPQHSNAPRTRATARHGHQNSSHSTMSSANRTVATVLGPLDFSEPTFLDVPGSRSCKIYFWLQYCALFR